MRNLEFKARYADLSRAERIARALGAEFGGNLHQEDTYFQVPAGRLKLRAIDRARSELIFYQRPEDSPARWSDYFIAAFEEADSIRDVLSRALGVRQRVEKLRQLFLYRGARIHLDRVARLGEFIEFEVPTRGDDDAAKSLLRTLLHSFGLRDEDAIQASYGELIERNLP